MTNEELAISIQSGNESLFPVLWQQVEKFVIQQAGKFHNFYCRECTVEQCDLIQEGYIAMIEAVKTYNGEKGSSFIGWLNFYLKRRFAVICNFVTMQGRFENSVESINRTIGEDDDLTIEDSIADPHDYIGDADNAIYNNQLHEALDDYIGKTLTIKQSEIIRSQYFSGESEKEIAKDKNISVQRVAQIKSQALIKLNQYLSTEKGKQLLSFIDGKTDYKHKGISAFLSTGTSEVEDAVFSRDEMLCKYFKLLGVSKRESF